MPGLTVKVFRTYNASITLQDQLDKLTNRIAHNRQQNNPFLAKDNVHQKLLSYNRANRQVAILCNHQRAVPKTHEKSMENLNNKAQLLLDFLSLEFADQGEKGRAGSS